MEDEYMALLDRTLEKVPRKDRDKKRFELPSPLVRRVGYKTLILNFLDISSRLNRDPRHILKFMSRELATAGSIEDIRVTFQGKFDERTISRLIDIYTKHYVICPICKSPDTKVSKEGKFNFLICEACGAKASIVD